MHSTTHTCYPDLGWGGCSTAFVGTDVLPFPSLGKEDGLLDKYGQNQQREEWYCSLASETWINRCPWHLLKFSTNWIGLATTAASWLRDCISPLTSYYRLSAGKMQSPSDKCVFLSGYVWSPCNWWAKLSLGFYQKN